MNEIDEIIKRVLSDTTANVHSIHGRTHWDRVASFGRRIAENEEVHARILLLFAYFHDSQRLNDGRDPEHGPRAAEYVGRFPRHLLGLSDPDIERLQLACRHHTYECETDDLTVRACWDSDRLDLGRVGIVPDPDRLTTGTAKRIAKELA